MGRVFYATNRNPDNAAAPTSFGTGFNGAKPGKLIFGIADVTVASGHGSDGLPFEAASPGAVQLSDASPDKFSDAARQQILTGPAHLILSLHGFQYFHWESIARVDYLSRWFAEGTYGDPNTMIAFGWPSQGDINKYDQDWSNSTSSGPALAQMLAYMQPLIDDFRANQGRAARVTLLAHSMGNHLLDAGLASLTTTPPPTYNRVILVAADEARGELWGSGNLVKTRTIGDRVYVYYNNQDLALSASQLIFHPFVYRLGFDGPTNKEDFKGLNVTFMNASAAGAGDPSDPNDSEGHQYYRMIDEVRDDICAVMRGMADSAIPNRIYRDDPHYNWHNYWRIDLMNLPTV